MREFYFEDKLRNSIVMGICPHDDMNWGPLDYYMYSFALARGNLYNRVIDIKGRPKWADEVLVNRVALKQTQDMIADMLRNTLPDCRLQQILARAEWTKKQQIKLWKNVELRSIDLLWFNWLAQQMGYLLDVYHIETIPEVYKQKQSPLVFREEDNGEVEKIGETNMSDGEMKALLRQRRVQTIRVYHKNDVWHCFYGTYKGINGEESGSHGSQPHLHYISDKWGMSREELNRKIQTNEMPSSPVHILLKRDNCSKDSTET